MLGMKSYDKEYIRSCRALIDRNLKAYDTEAKKVAGKTFEIRYFNSQVLLLDYMFVHRLSGMEGKDGNPLNEVRVLCNSILLNDGKLQVEKLSGWPNAAVAGLTLSPDRSILGLKPGQPVRLTRADFVRLADAFF